MNGRAKPGAEGIVYPREYDRRKDAIFAAVVRSSGRAGRALAFIGLSFRPFPESPMRAAEALKRAKRQPKGLLRRLKHLLIWSQYNWSRRYFDAHPGAVAMCWNGLTGSRWAYMAGARDAGARRLYVELAPLPGRITLDAEGVNAESSLPRGRAFYDRWAVENPDLTRDWRALNRDQVARPSRRPDVGQSDRALPVTPFLFVPLQVPDDSQIRLFAGWSGGLDGFIAALGRAAKGLPEGWHLRLKEHPSAKQSLAAAIAKAAAASGGRIVLDNDSDTFAQVAASRGVVTLNSSVGLQAFFFDKPVVVAGEAFFAIPDLVTVADSEASLVAALAGAGELAFDPGLRAAVMAYLGARYYPVLAEGDTGLTLNAGAVRAVLGG